MPNTLKRKIATLAILVIALQVLLPGFVALSATTSPFAPAIIICHSDAGPDVNWPASQPASADNCCAHCILCNGLASAPPLVALPNYIVWALPGDVLAGRSSHEPAAMHQPSDNFARGPPLSA